MFLDLFSVSVYCVICNVSVLVDMARKFGLTPEQFGENLRDNYQRYDVEQDPVDPLTLAEQFISK